MTEAELEAAIRAERHRFLFAQTPEKRTEHWNEMKRLIGQRSPETVARLEREKGLV